MHLTQLLDPPSVYMAGKMVLRCGGGGDNKVPGKSYRPFDHILACGVDADDPISPIEPRTLFGVPLLYTGPWQAMGSYHGLIHGITDCCTLDPSGIVARAQHGIRQCDLFFALLDDEDCYGTLAEIGYAKGIGKLIIAGVEDHVLNRCDPEGRPTHQMGSELWFAIEMADVRLSGGNTSAILRQFAALLSLVAGHRTAIRSLPRAV